MATPEVFPIAQVPITAHAFNPDRSMVALSANTSDAQIMTRIGSEWKTTSTLTEHDKLITSIDWAPNTNRIVTCAQDRNAYVWTQVSDPTTNEVVWKPTLVVLRINRSATYVRWSPNEDKFAVASGARNVCICSFDDEAQWWASKQLKKPIRSTVLSIDWHPNSVVLAAGCADAKARVFSAYIREVDKKPGPNVWGEKFPFNTVCGEYASSAGGWVHSVGFSPSGDILAFASHDSTITIVYPGAPAVLTIKSTTLPYVTLTWTSEDSLVAAGHDCQPVLFSGTAEKWTALGSLDDVTGGSSARSSVLSAQLTGASAASRSGVGRLNNAAFNRFKEADSRGTPTTSSAPGTPFSPGGPNLAGGVVGGATGAGTSELLTVHQNTITSVRPYEVGSNGTVTKVSTSGVDGRLVVWSVSAAAGLVPKLASIQLR